MRTLRGASIDASLCYAVQTSFTLSLVFYPPFIVGGLTIRSFLSGLGQEGIRSRAYPAS